VLQCLQPKSSGAKQKAVVTRVGFSIVVVCSACCLLKTERPDCCCQQVLDRFPG